MSRTRELIAGLRRDLGEADPAPPAIHVERIPDPPVRVFPSPTDRPRVAHQAAAHTTALVGIGRVGTRYATSVVLQFQAELAVAHAAVAEVLPDSWAEENGLIGVTSRVTDHRQFLLRPDLGRRLDEPSLARLAEDDVPKDIDVQPILADGLSAVACMGAGVELLSAFSAACRERGFSVGAPLCAKFARVWLQDEIGAAVRAKVAVILLGERPGLGTGDGLSAYLVHGPQLGRTDGDRNMMSNIHERGVPPVEAASRLASLVAAMLEQGRSGVTLDLADVAGVESGLRPPQVRVPLVETGGDLA
ncbi:MAG: ethanolamine ammonia-lyase subunit EutC [Deltaproteobacteria bacterium]|nr:ethanolamine ammonia-lyase subunit EutC [Deltaproteobacteria bacterium]